MKINDLKHNLLKFRYFSHYFFIVLFFNSFLLTQVKAQTFLPDEQNTIDVFKKAAPYVVNVHRYTTVMNGFRDIYQVPTGTGSGFIWDKYGHVVTNFHVVRGTRTLAVTLRNGKVVSAKVVGVAPRKDIAVLKLASTSDLPPINDTYPLPIADSSLLLVGQKTIAIGNPFGLGHTLTTGIISALGRQIRGITNVTIHDMIQTDASINPGNSGGPLLDSRGQLIGMNTLIFSSSGASAGIGFAVPSNTIKRVVDQLIKHGRVIRPSIGVHILPDALATQLGIQGVIIADVMPGSPADKAGLQGSRRDRLGKIIFGDIIIAVDDQRIKNFDELNQVLDKKKVGQKIKLTLLRDKKIKHVKLKLVDYSDF